MRISTPETTGSITIDSWEREVPALRSAIQGDVLLPGDEGYEASLERWSIVCIKRAALVIKPKSAQDVSSAILFATKHNIPFTTCGGGHSTAGTSSSDGGMVIHLSHLRSVSVDPEKRLISYGGGCTWKDVDDEAWKHGLATVGGTVSHTGVGGLVLGGGQGLLSGLHGLAVDCLVEVEVVLADGSVVTASETENADLFWGLRGAGASFGVVTRFTSKVFPQGRVWSGALIYPTSKLPELVAWANEFIEKMDGGQFVVMAFAYAPPPNQTPIIVVQPFHNGTGKEAKEGLFKGLLEAEPLMDMTQEMDYPVANTLVDASQGPGARRLTGGTNLTAPFSLSKWQEMEREFYARVDQETDRGNDMRTSALAVEMYKKDKVASVGFGATAYSNRGMYFDCMVLTCWTDPAKDGDARGWNRELAQNIKGRNHTGETGGVGQYNNYFSDVVDVKEGFKGNAKRLVELKRKYDPENRFSRSPWKIVVT
ncbi:FAD binding domain-containing protein [Colletotrichum karsti]|uniref:FAD binding domain-containing protein n=1 Tax=Colletotrichum karsti TaxID=1095194 RepID=A0A9P6HXR9_9PEZI|nr:FAD binding domain-containing protein [Colletotrichum karsti]KAF9873192.1 FAD binding domain-containing protein [Colletotrichum karsti]